MPVGFLLVGMRHVEQLRFGEMRARDLQAHRQIAHEAAGNRHGRHAGEIRADRVDVVEIHLDRIRGLRADAEGDVGRGGAHEHVDFRERALEVLVDQLPHALRLQVVRVVVAGGQHVRARHDAALDLGAEALAARALVQVHQILRILGAIAVTHAVEAREVRRTLGRRHHVVRGHGQRQRRQLDLDQLRAELLVDLERLADELLDARRRGPCRRTP